MLRALPSPPPRGNLYWDGCPLMLASLLPICGRFLYRKHATKTVATTMAIHPSRDPTTMAGRGEAAVIMNRR